MASADEQTLLKERIRFAWDRWRDARTLERAQLHKVRGLVKEITERGDMSQAEIARVVGVSKQAVNNMIHRYADLDRENVLALISQIKEGAFA